MKRRKRRHHVGSLGASKREHTAAAKHYVDSAEHELRTLETGGTMSCGLEYETLVDAERAMAKAGTHGTYQRGDSKQRMSDLRERLNTATDRFKRNCLRG